MIGKRFVTTGVLALTLVGSGLLLGQEKAAPPVRVSLPKGWKKLDLTDQQKEKIYAIERGYRTKMAPIQAKLKAMRAEEHAALVEVLTPAQKAELENLLANQAKRSKGKRFSSDDKASGRDGGKAGPDEIKSSRKKKRSSS